MKYEKLAILALGFFSAFAAAQGQQVDSCAELKHLQISDVEITKTERIASGKIIPPAYPGAPSIGPLPAHCCVDGIVNRRKGVDGQEFGIGFAIALPDREAWNGDFMMRGGGGGNGFVAYPTGASYAGRHQQTFQRFPSMGVSSSSSMAIATRGSPHWTPSTTTNHSRRQMAVPTESSNGVVSSSFPEWLTALAVRHSTISIC